MCYIYWVKQSHSGLMVAVKSTDKIQILPVVTAGYGKKNSTLVKRLKMIGISSKGHIWWTHTSYRICGVLNHPTKIRPPRHGIQSLIAVWNCSTENNGPSERTAQIKTWMFLPINEMAVGTRFKSGGNPASGRESKLSLWADSTTLGFLKKSGSLVEKKPHL